MKGASTPVKMPDASPISYRSPIEQTEISPSPEIVSECDV